MRKRGRALGAPKGIGRIIPLLTAIAVMLLAVAVADLRIRPVVESMIAYQAKAFAYQAVNTAILAELTGDQVEYGDIVKLTRSENSGIKSIETDMRAVNLLKARLSAQVAQQLEQQENQRLYVPIGTLLGNQFTSGRGPSVEIQVIPRGYVQSEIYNEFSSAGINQTLHQVMLKSTVQMVALLPGYAVSTQVETSFCLAETVIVGEIPEGFISLGDPSLSAKLYGGGGG